MPNIIPTRLSTKGQLILPKAIRDRRNWSAGTPLLIEDTPDGVLVRAIRPAKAATMDEIVGCVNYRGPHKAVGEMNEGVLKEARRQFRGSEPDEGD